jgi:hypothetical protein
VNVGIVGRGPRADALGDAFQACGARIVARTSRWDEMLEDHVQALGVACDAETNLRAHTACMEISCPCFVVGRLPREPTARPITAPTFVDNVPLWEPLYQRLRVAARGLPASKHVEVWRGNGGAETWQEAGVIALAVARDLASFHSSRKPISKINARLVSIGTVVIADAEIDGADVTLVFGDTTKPHFFATIAKERKPPTKLGGPVDKSEEIKYREKDGKGEFQVGEGAPIKSPHLLRLVPAIERFMWDVDVGRVDTYLVDLSAAAEADLKEIAKAVGLP